MTQGPRCRLLQWSSAHTASQVPPTVFADHEHGRYAPRCAVYGIGTRSWLVVA
ncbi:uncharacterized protein SEPMUDRAFT_128884, partial [Sphaerulina musiva SO2202]